MMETLSLYLLTWNVAVNPPKEDLHELLDLEDVSPDATNLPDIYVTGFQEVGNQPQKIVYNTLFEDEWTNAVRSILGRYGYVKIKTNRLVGIVLSVYVRRDAILRYTDIETEITRTGFGGLWGNKGSVSIRFSMSGASLVFVTSHLAALDGFYEERINDYHSAVNSQKFKYTKSATLFQHDYTFWVGDFNFRLEPDTLTTEEIIDLVKERNLSQAFQHDELVKAMTSGRAFALMSEMTPGFPPTYKYKVGTHEYDRKRRPAWTDRILSRAAPWDLDGEKLHLEQLTYRALKNYTLSDHKPVTATFSVNVPSYREGPAAEFKILDDWTLDRPGEAIVTLSKAYAKSTWDWVGLFRQNFTSLDEYHTYVWVPVQPLSDNSYLINIPTDSLRIPGTFQLVYMSHAGSCVKGISEPFELKFTPALIQNRFLTTQEKRVKKDRLQEEKEAEVFAARRRFENDVVSILSKGYLRSYKPYTPPASVAATVQRLATECSVDKDLDLSSKAKLLSACAKEFDHEVPNSILHQIKNLDTVIEFYTTPVDPRIPLERMQDMELPPNLHVKKDYVRFDAGTDTRFKGIDALPNRSTIIASLASRKKGLKHVRKDPAYPWPRD